MAVQQNKKSPSKRGMHRSHNALTTPGHGDRADHRRNAPAPPHQPDRLLPWPQGAEDQGRRLIRACAGRRARARRRRAGLALTDRLPLRPLPPLPRVIGIAVDCMGGDHGPSVTLPACRAFLAAHPHAELLLVGTRRARSPPAAAGRAARIVAATEVVEMDDPIEVALRRKKDSSMRVAHQPGQGRRRRPSRAQACVSAGNTGALMAVARYVLKTLDGIDRPAIAAVMPNAARWLHHRARPRCQRRLHAPSTCCSSR